MDKKKSWIEVRKGGDFEAIAKKHGISPVIARIIRNKDIIDDRDIEKYLKGDYTDLYDGRRMKDMEKGCCLMKKAIENGVKIAIIGDYDIDGVQSTYILYKGLKRCGADVIYFIPDRIEDGYGINTNLIDKAVKSGCKFIITCDNGIAAIDAIAYAKDKGITVIVTDHHDIPYEEIDGVKRYKESRADAIINPKQQNCPYPYKGLCGGGVAYKFIAVLYDMFGVPECESREFIENAGFATVGDVMELTDENRILVKIGLSMLRMTSNPGMNALIEATSCDKSKINSYSIGFILGPCINASGRLDTAKRSLQLLLEDDAEKCKKIAGELVSLNEERKEMTTHGVDDAIKQIEENHMENDDVLVIYLPNLHESIAGIVAGRIREKYYKPTFVLTNSGDEAKGSGRSTDEYSMYDELVKCADCLEKFGGHPKAAGLSLKRCNINVFRDKLNKNSALTEGDKKEKVRIDMVLPFEYVSMDMIKQLDLLEPCGNGNTKPVFAGRHIKICSAKVLGKNRNVVKMSLLSDAGTRMTGIKFCDADEFMNDIEARYGKIERDLLEVGQAQHIYCNMLFYPDINVFMGSESIQLIVKEIA